MSLLEVRSLPQDLSTEDTDQDTHIHLHTNTDTHIDVHTTSDTHLDANTDMRTDTHSNVDTLSCMQTDTHPNPHLSTFTNGTQPEMQPHTCQSSHNQPCLTDNAAGPVSVLPDSQDTEGVVFKAVGIPTNDDDDEEDRRLMDPAGDTGSPDPEQKPVQKDCSSSSAVIPTCDRKQIPPVIPGLKSPRIPPPVSPKKWCLPPTLLPRQHVAGLGGNLEESPGLVPGPSGPGVQALLVKDTSAMYASVIHPCRQPSPLLGCAPQEMEGGHFRGTVGIPIQESPHFMEQEMEGVDRVREMAVMDVSEESTMTPAPILKPPRNRPNHMPQDGPEMKACAAPIVEARCSLQALHLEESDQSPVGELDEEKGQGRPVCHQGSLSFFSSFSKFYKSTSLVKEIFTGDEWLPYLSVNSIPSQFTSQSEVETQPQSVEDQPESIPVPPMTRSDHSDEGNHSSTVGVPYYELIDQSDASTLVDKKQDAAQEEVNNKWRGQDIGCIPKAVLSSGAKLQKSPATKLKEMDIYDNIDLSCVKSHGLLDSSSQKQRIQLSRKRKSRRPLRKPTGGIYKIPRFAVFKLVAHPSISSSSSPVSSSSSSSHSPPNCLSSSIFYPAPSTLSSPLPRKRSKTEEDSTKHGCSSPSIFTSFFWSNLKEKAKRKNTQ